MSKNLTPHDVFFKQIFSQKEILANALTELRPADITRTMDVDTLVYLPGESVGEGLSRSTRADLLFSVSFGEREGRLAVILEHKSSPDPNVHFQILQMMVMGWMQHLREGKEPLPILPVIFYHGRRPWSLEDRFSSRMNIPNELVRNTPDFELLRIDLSMIDDDRIRSMRHMMAAAALLSMKHVFEDPNRFFSLLVRFAQERAAPYDIIEKMVILALDYAGHVHKNIPERELFRMLTTVTEETGMLTTTQKLQKIWIQEGRQEGIQEGIQEGLREGLREGIQKGIQEGLQEGAQKERTHTIRTLSQKAFTPQQIADLLSLDIAEVERILAQS